MLRRPHNVPVIAQYVRSQLKRVEARSVRSSVIPLYCAVPGALNDSVAGLSATGALGVASQRILDVISDVEGVSGSADPDRDMQWQHGAALMRLQAFTHVV